MSDSFNGSLPLSFDDETTPGGKKSIKWETIARVTGLMQATIIAGRLQASGIPARAWQEAAGQALGLLVGALGTGYVAVPEEYVDEALSILEEEE